MNRIELIKQIKSKKSYLCVGLDTDFTKIPKHLQYHTDAVFEFNKMIIDATKDYCISFKINTAFYEAMGLKGWEAMEKTLHYIPPTHLKIADAKRGDIGNTSAQYAKTFFEVLPFDAVTVAPYMGEDSIRPFLEYENKFAIVLGLTSNKGANDFELLSVDVKANHQTASFPHKMSSQPNDASPQPNNMSPHRLYENILTTVSKWGTTDNLMFVIGATQATELANIRKLLPDHFLLVPGVGFQGGSLQEVSKYGMNKDCGLLVNASRAIIYAGENENFAEEAKIIAQQYQREMENYLKA